jgi:hypothetical protein
MDQPEPFRLDEEQRARVRDCLFKEEISLPSDRFERFIREIEISIGDYFATQPKGTRREAHDALRELWEMSHEDDPSVALLRLRIAAFPGGAVDYIDRRFPIVFERLFSAGPPVNRFQTWALTADPANLIRATQVLSAEGAQWDKGRSRGGGKRSRPQVEPRIMDQARGAGDGRDSGGRPENEDLQKIILALNADWLHATETPPTPGGRSDQTGFGDLVHSVSHWIGLSEATAAYALRRYWAERRGSNSRK